MAPDFWNQDPLPDPEFAVAAAQFGGALDIRSLENNPLVRPDDFRYRENTRSIFLRPMNLFQHLLKRAGPRSPHVDSFLASVHFGYLWTMEPNAFCWKADGRYFMGVTAGLGHLLHGWAAHLLSFRSFMTDLIHGADEEEDGDLNALRDGFDLSKVVDRYKEEGRIHTLHRFPKSDARLMISFEVAHMAILFVFLHELGHAALGHIDFARDHYGMTGLRELDRESHSPPDYLQLSHLFEFMADNFSIELSLRQRIPDFYSGNPPGGYVVWSIATDLLLWLFAYRFPLGTPSGSHPYPQVRLFNKTNKLIEFEKKNPGYIVCRPTPDKSLPVDRFCTWVSAQLANSWSAMQLLGWEESHLLDDNSANAALANYRVIVRNKAPPLEHYEASIDWQLVYGLTGTPNETA